MNDIYSLKWDYLSFFKKIRDFFVELNEFSKTTE